MTIPLDTLARRRALTDIDSTLLVEAAAGTGKTGLIASRLTMLLASGLEPRHLVAITFTEAAASDLSARVHRYVQELLGGRTPLPLIDALPKGLSPQQRDHLHAARAKLDELTASTIHSFCQTIIQSYAVESDIDPGARIIDAPAAEVAFDAVFDRWLRRRLTSGVAGGDPITLLSKENPRQVVSTVRRLARFRREHRTARPIRADLTGRPDDAFLEAVRAFRTWLDSVVPERHTVSLVTDLEALASFYEGSFKSEPDFETLWRLAHPPRVSSMRAETSDLSKPRLKGAWQRAAGAADGERLNDQALTHFTRADAAYRILLGKVAAALAAILSVELDEVLADYERFKRAAAMLDFDDLLYRARDMVLEHDHVRIALGQRYPRILVDEFQDTDPVQAEILFRIAAADRPERWEHSRLRDGALFMVGDPKQAIYRFRGADIETYRRARDAIIGSTPENLLHITASFRSRADILEHVNRCFANPLSAPGQPGYVALTSTRKDAPSVLPCVAARILDLPPEPRAAQIRDAEAREVADICARLIGNLEIPGDEGTSRRLLPADVALLAPAGTELWRYEQALELRKLPFASQAGKNLFGRQEIQDLLCVARVLADPYDTLAFGALMRGPLVGLTEEELLDITEHLPPVADRPDRIPAFSVLTNPDAVSHAIAKETLTTLRDLRRRAPSLTPALLLSESVERLAVRPLLAAREGERSARAMANIDVFLELARGYEVRGLKQFVRDATRDWAEREPRAEGRVDADDAISVLTMHSAKGLEWPVVILINTATQFRPRGEFVHRPSDDTLHWVIGDVVPPELRIALQSDEEGEVRERQRVLYVAFTRARDLLILPKVPDVGTQSWAALVHGQYEGVPELDLSHFTARPLTLRAEPRNEQTAELFAAQQAAIAARRRRITWLRPSDDDMDRPDVTDLLVVDEDDVDTPMPVGAGRLRGLILHKLIEEVLTGEIVDAVLALAARAHELIAQLAPPHAAPGTLPDTDELATTIQRTLTIPDIAALRPSLVPELALYGTFTDTDAISVAGRADAIHIEDGQATAVIDWKSDIAPSSDDVVRHAAQLRAYMRATKISRGVLVYMSNAKVHWLGAS